MAGNLDFNTGLLAKVQVTIDGAQLECKSLQTQMNGFQADLQAGWAGAASKAFTGSYGEFTTAYTKVLNGLNALQEAVGSAGKALGVNEAQVQAHAKTVASGLVGQLNNTNFKA